MNDNKIKNKGLLSEKADVILICFVVLQVCWPIIALNLNINVGVTIATIASAFGICALFMIWVKQF